MRLSGGLNHCRNWFSLSCVYEYFGLFTPRGVKLDFFWRGNTQQSTFGADNRGRETWINRSSTPCIKVINIYGALKASNYVAPQTHQPHAHSVQSAGKFPVIISSRWNRPIAHVSMITAVRHIVDHILPPFSAFFILRIYIYIYAYHFHWHYIFIRTYSAGVPTDISVGKTMDHFVPNNLNNGNFKGYWEFFQAIRVKTWKFGLFSTSCTHINWICISFKPKLAAMVKLAQVKHWNLHLSKWKTDRSSRYRKKSRLPLEYTYFI